MKYRTISIEINSEEVPVNIIRIRSSDGILLMELSKLIDLSPSAIWSHITSRKLAFFKLRTENIEFLKRVGIVGNRVNRATLVPRASIVELSEVIDKRNQALEIYRKIWGNEGGSISSKIQRNFESSNSKNKQDISFDNANDFPSDCIETNELAVKYFPGVSKAKVQSYLEAIDHPRGVYLKHRGSFAAVLRPFKIEGLEHAAQEFFTRRELVKTTAKTRIWKHPLVGRMHELKNSEDK